MIVLIALMLACVVHGETISIYSQVEFQQTSLSMIRSDFQAVTSATRDYSLSLSTYQSVIDIADGGEYYFDIKIVDRRCRHLVFCLYKKGQLDPKSKFLEDRSLPDTWKLNCDALSINSTLFMSNRTVIKKPAGYYYLIVYQLDTYVPNPNLISLISVSSSATFDCSSSCYNNGFCKQGEIVCTCANSYFGPFCEFKSYKMETDTLIEKITLRPYESFYFTESYFDGEPTTTIELKSLSKPRMLSILNDIETNENINFVTENNNRYSQTTQLTQWVRDVESNTFDVEKKHLFATYINLSGETIELTLTVGRTSAV